MIRNVQFSVFSQTMCLFFLSVSSSTSKKPCLCAPVTHPGSFKCSLHRATASSHTRTGNYFCYEKRVVTRKVQFFVFTQTMCFFPSFFAVSSSANHTNGVKYTKNLNPLKLAAPSQSGGIRNSSKGNVHGKPKLSRFGRAALAHAAAAATSSVQIQPISAAFGQMSLS